MLFNFRALAALGLLLQSVTGAAMDKSAIEPRATGYKNMAYYGSWYDSFPPEPSKHFIDNDYRSMYRDDGKGLQSKDLVVKDMTHVIYAFANIDSNGRPISHDPWADTGFVVAPDEKNFTGNNVYGNIKQLYLLKKKNRKLKTILSIGGYTFSQQGKFKPAIKDAASIKRFADGAVKLMADWGFDGIDIDWEYPKNTAEGEKFFLLVQETRKSMDRYNTDNKLNYKFILTISTSANAAQYNVLPLKKISAIVDNIQLMSYDFAGPWDATTGHHAAINNDSKNPQNIKGWAHKGVNDYIAKGVPVNKLLLGIPLYGRSFAKTAGLGKAFTGVGSQSKGEEAGSGILYWKDLPLKNAVITPDAARMAVSSYNSAKREFVTFENTFNVQRKMTWLKTKGLGGAFHWEAGMDKIGGESLIGTAAKQLGSLDTTQNQLKYPKSVYDNLRAGMPGE